MNLIVKIFADQLIISRVSNNMNTREKHSKYFFILKKKGPSYFLA